MLNNPDVVLSAWHDIIIPIVSLHVPYVRKRVNHPKLSQWLIKDVTAAKADRDRLENGEREKKEEVGFKKPKNRARLRALEQYQHTKELISARAVSTHKGVN